MTDAPLFRLPTIEIDAEARRLIEAGEEEAFLKLLDSNIGLARSDEEWRKAFPDEDPLLYFAVNWMTRERPKTGIKLISFGGVPFTECGPDTIKALLYAGATPTEMSQNKGDTAINRLLVHPASPLSVQLLELFLKHPGVELGAVTSNTHVPIRCAYKFLRSELPAEWDEKRRALVQQIIERTNDKTIAQQQRGLFHGILGTTDVPSYSKSDFYIKAAINRGLILDKLDEYDHPVGMLLKNNFHPTVSMLLAAGMSDEEYVDVSRLGMVGAVGELIDKHDRKHGTNIREAARGILEQELAGCESGKVKPHELLLTQHGATWQAQGLARQGMLPRLFEQADRYHTGTAAERLALLEELNGKLPENMRRYDSAPMQRSEPLTRPDTNVTVKYLRGAVPEMTKGGVA